MARYDRDVVNLQPQWVSICIGINDVWKQFETPAFRDWAVQIDEYEKNVETMILKVKDQVKGVFLCTPYFIEPNSEESMRKRMDEYGEVCKKLAKKYNCELIDFQKLYNGFCKYQHSSVIALDRVHPNLIGATLMAVDYETQERTPKKSAYFYRDLIKNNGF